MEKIIDDFINYLIAEKNISKHTHKNYESDFKIFKEYLIKKNLPLNFENIALSDLRSYFSYLKIELQYSNETMRRKIHSLSSLYKYLEEMNLISKNEMRKIHAPKQEKKIPIYMNNSEIKQFLKAIDDHAGHNLCMHKSLFLLMLTTGLRRFEVLALDWDDIDFEKNTVKVKGKGKKQRIVPLVEPVKGVLWEYLQERLPIKHNRALFLSQNFNRLSESPINNLFKKYIKFARLQNRGLTLHKLRHTFASLMINENDVNIAVVQEILGHADSNSTKVYAHLNQEKLQNEVSKISHVFKQ